jgi:hypothetical protein
MGMNTQAAYQTGIMFEFSTTSRIIFARAYLKKYYKSDYFPWRGGKLKAS